MQIQRDTLKKATVVHGAEHESFLQSTISTLLDQYQDDFIQDLSHISTAANFSGDMQVDKVEYLKDNLYRCDYSYNWSIAWTCSGTQEAGRVNEKVRFLFDPEAGTLQFKFLKLDA